MKRMMIILLVVSLAPAATRTGERQDRTFEGAAQHRLQPLIVAMDLRKATRELKQPGRPLHFSIRSQPAPEPKPRELIGWEEKSTHDLFKPFDSWITSHSTSPHATLQNVIQDLESRFGLDQTPEWKEKCLACYGNENPFRTHE